MAQARRRYTSVDGSRDWIVTVAWDESALEKSHWFEAHVAVVGEASGESLKLPPEMATYRIGEIEHSFREYVRIDWDGDQEAAIRHYLNTIYRRVYAFIEHGH